MSARIFKYTVILSVVAILAVAQPSGTSTSDGQCNTGSVQCCNNVIDPSASGGEMSNGLLGILDGGDLPAGLIGMDCIPIVPVIGIASAADCTQTAVCCSNETVQDTLFYFGCSPINV